MLAQSSGQVLRSYRCWRNPRGAWIILPKGIFIGRECMQKRGHRPQRGRPCGFSLDATSTPGLTDSKLPAPRPRRLLLAIPGVMDCPTFLFLTVTVSSGPAVGAPPSRACPPVHDYESFLLIRFIEPLHQTGEARPSPSRASTLSLVFAWYRAVSGS